jgi:hypothetical protein
MIRLFYHASRNIFSTNSAGQNGFPANCFLGNRATIAVINANVSTRRRHELWPVSFTGAGLLDNDQYNDGHPEVRFLSTFLGQLRATRTESRYMYKAQVVLLKQRVRDLANVTVRTADASHVVRELTPDSNSKVNKLLVCAKKVEDNPEKADRQRMLVTKKTATELGCIVPNNRKMGAVVFLKIFPARFAVRYKFVDSRQRWVNADLIRTLPGQASACMEELSHYSNAGPGRNSMRPVCETWCGGAPNAFL